MSMCKTCDGNGYLTNFPIYPPKAVMDEKDPKKQTEKFNKMTDFFIENMSYPCPDCKPLEYKVYKLELKCDKLERWFRRYIEKGRAGSCEACLNISPQEIIDEEVPMVEHIVEDEMWLEAERRHCDIQNNDPEVQKHVAEIIREKGVELREEAVEKLVRKKKKDNKSGDKK